MELPGSVTGLGAQLREAAEIAPDAALLSDPNVFAAERERIFTRPMMAVDHQSRLAESDYYFRCDVAPRPLILTRETGGRLHALRNICIHAGYPVCEAEEGAAKRLICLYHGWEYALDGRLVEPELSSRIDPSRLRLTEYPAEVCGGLIMVDLSGKSIAGEQLACSVPDWLATATVSNRIRYNTNWNWKPLRCFLQASLHLFCEDQLDTCLEFGPLSFMNVHSRRAVLIRIVPRFAEQTDFHAIEMIAADFSGNSACAPTPEAIADKLRNADTSVSWFDRGVAEWYWRLMSEEA